MKKWFECKVKYKKVNDEGKLKSMSELYLIDAVNFTEAESRMTEQFAPYASYGFDITAIKATNYAEALFSSDAYSDKWYKCKITFTTTNDKGKEIESSSHIVVQSDSLDNAMVKANEVYNNTTFDYRVSSVSETKIMDVYPYETMGESEVNND